MSEKLRACTTWQNCRGGEIFRIPLRKAGREECRNGAVASDDPSSSEDRSHARWNVPTHTCCASAVVLTSVFAPPEWVSPFVSRGTHDIPTNKRRDQDPSPKSPAEPLRLEFGHAFGVRQRSCRFRFLTIARCRKSGSCAPTLREKLPQRYRHFAVALCSP